MCNSRWFAKQNEPNYMFLLCLTYTRTATYVIMWIYCLNFLLTTICKCPLTHNQLNARMMHDDSLFNIKVQKDKYIRDKSIIQVFYTRRINSHYK